MSNESPAWNSYLFVGTHGYVVAIDKATGSDVWETSLPKTGYSVVSIVVEDNMLLCGSGGRLFALDPENGKILWTNGLKGKGTGLIYLTTARCNNSEEIMALFAQHVATQQAAAASGGGGAG